MAILIVTNSDDPTADFAEGKMKDSGVETIRFNTDQALVGMTHSFESVPEVVIGDRVINFNDITGIWYRRPEDPTINPLITDAQAKEHIGQEVAYYLKCLWKSLESKNWVSHPWAISWANVKLHQIDVAKKLGLQTPKSLATNDPTRALEFINSLNGKAIVKPFKHNVVKQNGVESIIYTSRVTKESLRNIDSIKYSVSFFQEEIAKKVEVRVTVFGNKVFAAEIASQDDPNTMLDWRRSSDKIQKWNFHSPPDEIACKCVELTKIYGLNYGAIDFALTPSDEYVFFELNPNGQWAWLEIQLGMPMTDALIFVLTQPNL